MTKSLQVLQLASFTGNIGDNANHGGTRAQFTKNLPYHLDFTELEIREFFWGKRQWDLALIDYINQFDLFMIGGGNFFELWVEKSPTGCSIELPVALLNKIKCPMLFYGLGVDAGQGVPQECAKRFKVFLKYLLENDRCRVAVRNDGALHTLERHFSDLSLDKVLHVPDGGFFYPETLSSSETLSQTGKKWIVVNVANDMLEQRFPGIFSDNSQALDYAGFNKELADTLVQLLEQHPEYSIIFVPHIWRDIEAIFHVLEELPDFLRRTRVSVASYLTGDVGAARNFNLYRDAELCLAMRFHANVCALAMQTPTIGLVNYPQIQMLYDELSLDGRVIQVNKKGFSNSLLELANSALNAPQFFKQKQAEMSDQISSDMILTMKAIRVWLSKAFE